MLKKVFMRYEEAHYKKHVIVHGSEQLQNHNKK